MKPIMIRRNAGRDLLSQLHNDFNQLLEPFNFRNDFSSDLSATQWLPSLDIKEDENCYLLAIDVPGVKVEDIDISMENGMLTLKGKREWNAEEEKDNYLRIERSFGTFFRQITLPESVDKEAIEAKCKDGVLQIVLPKLKKTKAQKVRVIEG